MGTAAALSLAVAAVALTWRFERVSELPITPKSVVVWDLEKRVLAVMPYCMCSLRAMALLVDPVSENFREADWRSTISGTS